MRKLLDIMTPENVFVEYELAGLGSRTAAAIVDSLIQLGLMLIVGIAMAIAGVNFNDLDWLGSTVIAIGIAILFVIWFGYYIFCEMLMNGQTPGKKAMKLRVIRQTGEPVTFFDSFLRNLLRVADILPSFYLVGAVLLIFTKHYKRIGDFAANTIVVKIGETIREENTLDSLIESFKPGNVQSEAQEPAGEIPGRILNVYPVNNKEYGVLKEFLLRKDELGSRFPAFMNCLTNYFLRKYQLRAVPFGDPIRFFRAILDMNSGLY